MERTWSAQRYSKPHFQFGGLTYYRYTMRANISHWDTSKRGAEGLELAAEIESATRCLQNSRSTY